LRAGAWDTSGCNETVGKDNGAGTRATRWSRYALSAASPAPIDWAEGHIEIKRVMSAQVANRPALTTLGTFPNSLGCNRPLPDSWRTGELLRREPLSALRILWRIRLLAPTISRLRQRPDEHSQQRNRDQPVHQPPPHGPRLSGHLSRPAPTPWQQDHSGLSA